MDTEKFARLNARLRRKTDRRELGQCLPGTAAALALPGDEATRLEALVGALGQERLIVAAPVEVRPGAHGEHRPHDLDSDTLPTLKTALSPAGEAVVAFTSALELAGWDRSARPLPVSAQTVALTALGLGVGRLWVDPGAAGLVIPGPAVNALAHGGPWLPPWRDTCLRDELEASARLRAAIGVTRIVIGPLNDGTGGVRVTVRIGLSPVLRLEQQQETVEVVLTSLAQNSRLRASADRIEFVPYLAADV